MGTPGIQAIEFEQGREITTPEDEFLPRVRYQMINKHPSQRSKQRQILDVALDLIVMDARYKCMIPHVHGSCVSLVTSERVLGEKWMWSALWGQQQNKLNAKQQLQFQSKTAQSKAQDKQSRKSRIMVTVSKRQHLPRLLYMLSTLQYQLLMNQSRPMLSANTHQTTLEKFHFLPPKLLPGSLGKGNEPQDSESGKRQSHYLPETKQPADPLPQTIPTKMISEQGETQYRTRRGIRRNDQKSNEKSRESQQEIAVVSEERHQMEHKHFTHKKQEDKQFDVFLKIVEYLKKIQWDKPTAIHKMNPFQYLTPSCFWFWVCAQYFSLNMGSNKTNSEAVTDIVNRINKIRYPIPTRLGKMIHFHQSQTHLLEFQTPKLNKACKPIVQILSACIPPSSFNSHAFQSGEKSIQITETSEDNLFRSTLRVTLFNYVKKNCLGHIQTLLQEGVSSLNEEQDLIFIPANEDAKMIEQNKNIEMVIEQEIGQNQNKQSDQITKKESLGQHSEIGSTNLINPPHKVLDQNDLLLDTILHLPLDKVISILEAQIQNSRFPHVQQNLIPLSNDPFELISPPHPEEAQFFDYLKKQKLKQLHVNENVQQPKLPNGDDNVVEDVKCQVCTDGDYTDDNLIVFCATCNISVHQRCVGLAKVPSESWICEVCHAFGPQGRFLRCPMCTVRGGALKRTTISCESMLFRDNNPSYHQYLRKCPPTKVKEQYPIPHKEEGADNKLFYDYYDPMPTVIDEPVCSYVWIHYTCSIWVPECYFEERGGVINTKGVENVDKKRFKLMCEVCHTSKTGAAIKCAQEDCCSHYHPQCARTSGVYMQQRYCDNLKYYIYCKTHQPLKLTRTKQGKVKKAKDEIVKFCRGIQKYIQTYKLAAVPFKLLKSSKKMKTKKQHKGKQVREVKENDHNEFMERLRDFMVSGRKLVVSLKRVGDKAFKVIDIQEPVKRTLKSNINKNDEIWQCFSYKNLSSSQLYKKYKKIMKEMVGIKDKFCRDIKNETKNQKKKDKKKNRQYEQAHAEEDPEQLYCVCRRKYVAGDLMMQCEICEEWYHFKCIGFIGTEDEASKVNFDCPQCEEFQDAAVIEERREKFKEFYIPGFVIEYSKKEEEENRKGSDESEDSEEEEHVMSESSSVQEENSAGESEVEKSDGDDMEVEQSVKSEEMHRIQLKKQEPSRTLSLPLPAPFLPAQSPKQPINMIVQISQKQNSGDNQHHPIQSEPKQ